jgi:hypothetical protein
MLILIQLHSTLINAQGFTFSFWTFPFSIHQIFTFSLKLTSASLVYYYNTIFFTKSEIFQVCYIKTRLHVLSVQNSFRYRKLLFDWFCD